MKSISALLLAPLAPLLVFGCGARSTLDLEGVETNTSASGGYTAGFGGQAGKGGAGGALGSGGARGSGGAINFGGTKGSGGIVSSGGVINFGGRPGSGGTIIVSGGAVGSSGGRVSSGGIGSGGRVGGSAGSIPTRGGSGGRAGGAGGGRGGAVGGGAGGAGAAGGGAGGATIVVGGAPGGSGGTAAGGAGGAVCPGLAINEVLIDDLNDGDRYIDSTDGRAGSWKVDYDETPGGTIYPDKVSGFTPTKTGDSCRQYAAYVKGSGFSDWGANMSFGLGSPYHAGRYTGISFWARNDPGTQHVIRVAFPDKDTDPKGNICKIDVPGPTACFDHYGYRITLSDVWTKYIIDFSQLTQDGWGLQGEFFDPESLYEVIFEIPENSIMSLWIDDVAFIYNVDVF